MRDEMEDTHIDNEGKGRQESERRTEEQDCGISHDCNDGNHEYSTGRPSRGQHSRQLLSLTKIDADDNNHDEVMTVQSFETQDDDSINFLRSCHSDEYAVSQLPQRFHQASSLRHDQTTTILEDHPSSYVIKPPLSARRSSQQQTAQLKYNQTMVILQDQSLTRMQRMAVDLAAAQSQDFHQIRYIHDLPALPEENSHLHNGRPFLRHSYSDELDANMSVSESLSRSTSVYSYSNQSEMFPRRVRFIRRQTTPALPTGEQGLHRQVAAALMQRPGAYCMRGSMLVERNEPAYLMPQSTQSETDKPNLHAINHRLEGCRRLAEDELGTISSHNVDISIFSDDTSPEGIIGKGAKLWASKPIIAAVIGATALLIAIVLVITFSIILQGGADDKHNIHQERVSTLLGSDIVALCDANETLLSSALSTQAHGRCEQIFRTYMDNTTNATIDCRAPEYLAATWLSLSTPPPTDARFTLATFFFSLGGPMWLKRDKWLSNENECEWFGIICDSDHNVVGIDLHSNLLRNEIPSLCMLPKLTSLQLSFNEIQGTLPLETNSSWEVLDLQFNRLMDSLERIAASLPQVRELNIRENDIYGPLSAVRMLPSSLQVLILEANQGIYGQLEREMFYFPRLERLNLSRLPNFHGTIPHGTFKSLNSLKSINLGKTRLEGRFPEDTWKLPSLETLLLSNTGLAGTIPSSAFLGNTDWKVIDIRNTLFMGTLPMTIGNSTKLKKLEGVDSKIGGSIPTTIGLCTSLESLVFRTSLLTGTIPSELGLLTRLEFLVLLGNDLTGTIPSELGGIKTLKTLELAQKGQGFTGTVPIEICSIPDLMTLTLHCHSRIFEKCHCCSNCYNDGPCD